MTERQIISSLLQNETLYRLVDFGEEAGVYRQNQCLKETEDECIVKFGGVNHRGFILLRGSFQECQDYGVAHGIFKQGDPTPKKKFTFNVPQKQSLPSVAHKNLLNQLNHGKDLSQIDNMLSNEYTNEDQENIPPSQQIPRKSNSTLTISKKHKRPQQTTDLLSVNASLNEVDEENSPPLTKIQRTRHPSATNQATSTKHRSSKPNNFAAAEPTSEESLTMAQVSALIQQQDARWTTKFDTLTSEHNNLKKELKSKKKEKKMMVNGTDLMKFAASSDLNYCMAIIPIIVPDIHNKCFSKIPGTKAKTSEREPVSLLDTNIVKGNIKLVKIILTNK